MKANKLFPLSFETAAAREHWLESHNYTPKGSIGTVEVWMDNWTGVHVITSQRLDRYELRQPTGREVPSDTKIQRDLL